MFKSKMKITAAVALSSFIALASLWAQPGVSSFTFPRFVTSSGADTGIAIVNPTSRAAVVDLALRSADGRDVRNASLTVPALGQIALTGAQIFGSSNLDGSLSISSSTAGLVVNTQTFDFAGTVTAGTGGASAPATTLVLPVISGSTAQASEIDILNPGTLNTSVDVNLFRASGELIARASVPVNGGVRFRGSLKDVFPFVNDFSAASHATVVSKASTVFSQGQPVTASSLISGLSPLSPGAIQDAIALNALAPTEGFNSGAIPDFRTGNGQFSLLALTNLEPSSVDVNVTAILADGSTAGTRRFTLNGNGAFRSSLQNEFPTLGSGERQGWLLIQATGRVFAAVIEGNNAGGLSVVPLQRTPQFQFVFPHAVQDGNFFSELKLANPGPNASSVEIFVVAPSGVTLAANTIRLEAGTALSETLDEIFSEVSLPLSGGFVFVRATQPLFGSLALGSASGSTLTSFAAESVPSAFSPAPLASFAIKGTVTLNGRPLAGVRVALSGVVSGITTTEADGSFIFRDLPRGRFSLRVEQFGFRFSPEVAELEIVNTNLTQDFEAFTAPNEIVVIPASIPVGSPDVTVAVFGSNFNPTSEAFVGNVRLRTTFVDPIELRVVLPEFLFASASTFDLHVVTDGSRLSDPAAIVAFVDRPNISSVSTNGSIVEGTAQATLTIVGSGFLPGAVVRINGRSEELTLNRVDSTTILVHVPGIYLAQGGIYPVTVVNPFPEEVESNVQLLTVFFPSPAVEAVEPFAVPVRLEENATVLKLDVFGFNFRRGAVVLFEDKPVPTVYCENTPACLAEHVIGLVPAENLRRSGLFRITVKNPDPSLRSSEAVFLRLEGLQPTITSVLPGTGTLLNIPPDKDRFTMPIVVEGTNFGPQTEVRIYKAGTSPLPEFSEADVVVIGSTQLYRANFEVRYPDSLGEWVVEVANPQPGGGKSQTASFLITEGTFVASPFLISLTPQVVPAGGPSFTLVVNGTNLSPGSQINFSTTTLPTTFVGSGQLRAEVPASLIRVAGKKPVSVTNPDNGGTSNRLFVSVE